MAALILTKTYSPSTVYDGDIFTWILEVKNNTADVLGNFQIQDEFVYQFENLDPDTTHIQFSGAGGGTVLPIVDNTVTGEVTNLNPSETVTITIQVKLNAAGASSIYNTFSTSSESDDRLNLETKKLLNISTLSAEVNKSDDISDTIPGGTKFNYILTVKNTQPAGGINMESPNIYDKLPDEVTKDPELTPYIVSNTSRDISGFSPHFDDAQNSYAITFDHVEPQEIITITIPVMAIAPGDDVFNSFTFNAAKTKSATATSESITITPLVAEVAKSADITSPIQVGKKFNYILTVKNTGQINTGANMIGPNIIDTLPTQITKDPLLGPYITSSTSRTIIGFSATFNDAANSYTITFDYVEPQEIMTITIPVVAIAPGDDAINSFIFYATATSQVEAESNSLTINPMVADVDKSDDATGTIFIGKKFNYILTVKHAQQTDGINMDDPIIIDTLPDEITKNPSLGPYIISSTSRTILGFGAIFNDAANSYTITFDHVEPQETITITIPVVAIATGDDAINSFTFSAKFTLQTSASSRGITVNPLKAPTITKFADQISVPYNGAFQYTLYVNSDSGNDLSGVHIIDKLPDGVVLDTHAVSPVVVSIGGSSVVDPQYDYDDGTFTYIIPSLSSTDAVEIILNVIGKSCGNKINTFTMYADFLDPFQPKDGSIVSIEPPIAPKLEKKASVDTIGAGGSFTYTLTVSNGISTLNTVSVIDTLPAGISINQRATAFLDTIQIIPFDYDLNNNIFTYEFDSLDANSVLIINIPVIAPTEIISDITIINSFKLKADCVEVDPGVSATVTVLATTNEPKFTKSISGGPKLCKEFTYTLTVDNSVNRTTSLTNVILSDILPNNVKFVAAPGGTYIGCKNKIIFRIATINPGDIITRKIIVKAVSPGKFSNSAILRSSQFRDPIKSNKVKSCVRR